MVVTERLSRKLVSTMIAKVIRALTSCARPSPEAEIP